MADPRSPVREVMSRGAISVDEKLTLRSLAAVLDELMPVPLEHAHPTRFDGPPRVVALGYQLRDEKLVGPRDRFDDPSFDNARKQANDVFDYLCRLGPFEPHRLPLEEMEYTTMPEVAARLTDRWEPLATPSKV